MRDVIGGRALRGYSCEVTASRARVLSLERRVSIQKGPRKDRVPGLGYFGVRLRPYAREVTKCRSPPINLT